MGVEAFGISMHFVDPGVYGNLREFFTGLPQIHIDDEKSATDYITVVGEYEDDRHIIEIQISRNVISNACTMAVRFSLCSYESIDSIFIDIVSKLLSSFDADVWLMTSALNQKANYLPGDHNWLIAALPDEIAAMRSRWQHSFGKKQGRVCVDDSFYFVGIITK